MFATVRTLLFGGLSGKVLGIGRELLAAALLGTGPVAAAYRLSQSAFQIPLQGFLSDTLNAGFTPAYARDLAHAQRGRALFAGMHAVLLVVSVLVAALLAMLAARWVRLLAPGFTPPTAALATQMVRLLALALPLYALQSLYASVDLAAGRARMMAARASLQSVGVILGILLAWRTGQPELIAAGFVLSYLVLTLWGLKSVLAQRLRLWPRRAEWGNARASLRAVWMACRTILWIPAILQVQQVVERRVASTISLHAVPALDYARFVSETATVLLAVPFALAGLAAMPTLSESEFQAAARRSSRLLLYVGLPLSVALGVHAEYVVRILYARGAFGVDSVATTTAILQALAVGLWAQLLAYAGGRFLNARGRNRALVGFYLAAAVSNVALNLLLAPLLGAAALGCAAAVNSMILGFLVVRELGLLPALRADFLALTGTAVGYLLVWRSLPAPWAAHPWLPPLLFAGYWAAAGLLVPHCRRTLTEIWHALRRADQTRVGAHV